LANKLNIVKELKENQVVLLAVNSAKYNETVLINIKKLSKKSVGYVTLNKTFKALKEKFESKKVSVENIVFIDTISKSIMKVPDQTEGCYYVSAPNALTELSIAINRILRHDFKYLVFDSLTTLSIYQSSKTAAKFSNSIINQIRSHKTSAVFYILDAEDQNPLLNEISLFADKVIKVK